jgi:hypothetical protein
MTPATRARLIDSFTCCYQTIGPDVWGEETIFHDEFISVMRDQIHNHVQMCDQCFATNDDVNEFFLLPHLEQEHLIEKAGP